VTTINLKRRKPDDAASLADRMARWRERPDEFARKVLGARPTPQQDSALRAIAAPGARVAIKSGHGTGKTALASWAILWQLLLWRDVKIPCTAPSAHQLRDNLWGEIAKWRANMPPMFRELVKVGADHACVVDEPETRFAVARTARKEAPEALQGFHAKRLLFVVDEASGVPDEVFQVVQGALSTEGARVLMLSNPTRTDGYFFDAFDITRAAGAGSWARLTFSCLDSPLVGRDYASEIARQWGADSDVYRVRVLGEFPSGSPDAIIPLHWVQAAIGRDIAAPVPGARSVLGLDVARYGDDATAVVIRSGSQVTYLDQWRGKSTMETVGRVYDLVHNQRLADVVMADVIGLGSGVVDRLAEMGVSVVGVNVSECAAMSDRYSRLRDELWFRVREWFGGQSCKLPPGNKWLDYLVGELTAPRYSFPSGKVKVESKDELRKRGVASPNLADALCLTFAEGVRPAPGTGRPAAAAAVRTVAAAW
jgi:hypothetical protein